MDATNTLTFYYASDGVTGFHLKNNLVDDDFYYKKNAQNDIIGIYTTDNKQIARYDYDAWGNQKIQYFDEILQNNLLKLYHNFYFCVFNNLLFYKAIINKTDFLISHKV